MNKSTSNNETFKRKFIPFSPKEKQYHLVDIVIEKDEDGVNVHWIVNTKGDSFYTGHLMPTREMIKLFNGAKR
jgi:hypothetical protein